MCPGPVRPPANAGWAVIAEAECRAAADGHQFKWPTHDVSGVGQRPVRRRPPPSMSRRPRS
jgi:hypothetical protein